MIEAELMRNSRGGAHVAIASFRLPWDTGARLWWGVWSDARFVFLACFLGWVWEFSGDRDGLVVRPLKRPES